MGPRPDGPFGRAFVPDGEALQTMLSVSPTAPIERALLRRSVGLLTEERPRCAHCHRTPLVGERVYVYGSGTIACELCRGRQRDDPLESRVVHGPEFGHTMRITDQRAAA